MNDNNEEPFEKLPAGAVKIARMTQVASTLSATDIAQALIRQEGDADIAYARLQALQRILTDALKHLSAN